MIAAPQETLLKRTRSRCPVCHAACPAKVVVRNEDGRDRVYLSRRCVLHGLQTTRISSDARFYWLAKGSGGCCGGSACCAADGEPAGTLGANAAGRGDGPFEKLSTCLALIEVVDACNLSCPTCYADSPRRLDAGSLHAHPLEELKTRIQGVIDRKGVIDILQLSGGEPTLHPEFFNLLEWTQRNDGIRYVLLNTNGVRIAQDDAFLGGLAEAARRRNFQVYLQFDGTAEAGQRALRGADLRAVREAAIARCGSIGLPVTLAMTVTPENLDNVWEAAAFGLRFPHVRGVSYQPFFSSGRRSAIEAADYRPLNTADVILRLVENSNGMLGFDDFTPLPCGDPNCATIGYLLRVDGAVKSVSEFVDFRKLQGFLRDKVRYSLDDLAKCGCESDPLGELLREFELDESHTFRLFVKPFMDAFTWDDDRIDRCCTHVIRPDGRLDSFCRYYSGFPDVAPAP